MVVGAVILGIFGIAFVVSAGHALLWLHKMRKLSDVTGTIVARNRQFTGRSNWTYPVVEFAMPDGTQIRRTFRQAARPTIGRKLRIVYDPAALPDGRTRVRMGLHFVSSAPMIYSVWVLIWLWLMAAAGLAFLAGCILAVASG